MHMGKKLDALLGRSLKPTKFKALVNLAISRLAVLKNQRQIRCSQARSDVIQLLNLGHHERALLRVEQVIKEQNMLDVFVMIESYCNLLLERVNLIQQEKECPDELKEATAGLIFAAARCGEFPELQELRAVFMSYFGREFVARAAELRNNCGVNPKMIQKLSTRHPTLETRMKVLKEIASENGIILKLEEADSIAAEDISIKQNRTQPEQDLSNYADSKQPKFNGDSESLPEGIDQVEGFNSLDARKRYKDVADAAQEAFQSAAYAAAAARAAVELSRSHPPRDNDHGSSSSQRKYPKQAEATTLGIEKHQSIGKHSVHSKDEEIQEGTQVDDIKLSKKVDSKAGCSTASPELLQQTKPSEEEIIFDNSDDGNEKKESNISPLMTHGEPQRGRASRTELPYLPNKQVLPSLKTGIKVESELTKARTTDDSW
ncbi:hypothetical protein Ancab_018547 [Ancistrocladus abbreviatus]